MSTFRSALGLSGPGFHNNRARNATQRVVALLVGCAFIGVGFVLFFDGPGNLLGASVLWFFGLLLAVIPIVFRPGKADPTTLVLNGEHGTFLPANIGTGSRLATLIILAVVFYGIAIAGIIRAIVVSDVELPFFALLVCLGFGTLFAWGARGIANARRSKNPGIFLTASAIHLLDRLDPVIIAWDEIQALRPHWTKSHRALQPVKNWLTFERSGIELGDYRDVFALQSGAEEPTIKLDHVSADARPIIAGFEYYLAYPGARSELGTALATDRFAAK